MDKSPSVTLKRNPSLQSEIEVNNPEINRNYANFEIQKSSIKWLVVFAVVLFVVFLGLLLGSVLLGVKVTKDVEVRDGELVYGKDKSLVVKTTEKTYTHTVTIDTPLEVLQEVTSISVFIPQSNDAAGSPGVFKFKVIGFERIPGRKLIIHGHTHHAVIQPDGSVKIIQAFTSNNKKSVEIRDGTYATVVSLVAALPSVVYQNVDTCNKLKSLAQSGRYRLVGDLTCILYSPLETFKGIFNGQGYTLTITLNVVGNNKEAALWRSLEGANVFNLNVAGAFTGVGKCATFALSATPGTIFLSNKATASVTCSKKNGNNKVIAAAFVAEIPQNSATAAITFQYCLSAATITVEPTSNAILGGFFGLAHPTETIVSKYNYFFSYFPSIPNKDLFSAIGMRGTNKREGGCSPDDPNYNAYCWINFNYNSDTGYSDPTDAWWDCCQGWDPCAGCMYDKDPAGCRFALCWNGNKRSSKMTKGDEKSVRTLTLSDVVNYVHIPYIQNNCFITA